MKKWKIKGFWEKYLVEIMIIVAIIGLILAILIPLSIRVIEVSQTMSNQKTTPKETDAITWQQLVAKYQYLKKTPRYRSSPDKDTKEKMAPLEKWYDQK